MGSDESSGGLSVPATRSATPTPLTDEQILCMEEGREYDPARESRSSPGSWTTTGSYHENSPEIVERSHWPRPPSQVGDSASFSLSSESATESRPQENNVM